MPTKTPVKRIKITDTLKSKLFGVFVVVGAFLTSWRALTRARGASKLRTTGVVFLVALSLGAAVAGTLTSLHPATTNAASTTSTLNFQARLMTSTGAIVPDGNYNIEFKLYSAATSTGTPNQGACTMTPGTTADPACLWTETRTGANVVTVVNGYLTVNLGSVNAFPTTINWDQQLWLSMRVGGTGAPSWDPEMSTPSRLVLTGIPYAFKAGQLAQLNSGNGFESTLGLVQPTVGNQVFQVPDQAVAGTFNLLAQNSSTGIANLQGASTLGTTSGALTVQSGGANANLTLTANGTGILAVDTGGSGTVNIGTVHATTVAVGNGSSATSILSGSTLVVGNNAVNKSISIGATGSTANTTSLLLATSTGATQTIQVGGTGASGGSASGTTIALQAGATALSLATGGTTVRTYTNSSTAFQVLDTGGGTALDVDTSGDRVGVGSAPNRILTVAPQANALATLGIQSSGGSGAEIDFGTNGGYQGAIGYGRSVGGVFEVIVNGTTPGTPQTGGHTAVTVTSTGSALFQNISNSTTAFQVQDASGTPLINADTTNMKLEVTGGIDTPFGGLGRYQNLLSYSEQLDQSIYWVPSNITVGANNAVAPDGNTTAETLTASSTTNNIGQLPTVSGSTTYTFSWWAKLGTLTGPSYAVYDFTHSAYIVSPTSYGATSNGWQRISVTFVTPSGTTSIGVYPEVNSSSTGTMYIWGAQLEQASSAGTYVKTSGTTVSTASTGLAVSGATFTNLLNCNQLYTTGSGFTSCNGGASATSSRLEISGHSYTYGLGASNFNNRYTSRLAGMLHAQEVNHGISGAAASFDNVGNVGTGDGGYAQVLQDITTTRTSAPYVPRNGIGLINFGVNDLAYGGSGTQTPYIDAMRTIISRYRASAVFEDSDASIAYGGTWSTTSGCNATNATYCSGSSVHKTTAVNSTATITVPSDFPGGTIDLGFVAEAGGSGATWSICVDNAACGSPTTKNTVNGAPTGHKTGMVVRLTSLASGTHTIYLKDTSLTTQAYFDYWQIEATNPPLVLVDNAARIINQTYGTFTVTDALVNTMNANLTSLMTEFDSSVVLVNADTTLNDSHFAADNLHPNDEGHALLAQANYNAIQSATPALSQTVYSSGAFIDQTNGKILQNANNSTAGFQVQNAAGSTVLDVDTTNGRLGVGTVSPTTTLDVEYNIASSVAGGFIKNSSSSASAYANLQIASNAQGYNLVVGSSAETAFNLANKFSVFDSTNAKARLTVDSSGNIAVGDDGTGKAFNAMSKLQVNGSVTAFSTTSTTALNSAFFLFNNTASAGNWGSINYGLTLGYNTATSRYNSQLFGGQNGDVVLGALGDGTNLVTGPSGLYNMDYTKSVLVRGDTGQVGIGTGAPTADLSFGNNADQTINVIQSGAATNGHNLSITAGAGNGAAKNGGNLVLSGGAAGAGGTEGSVMVTPQNNSFSSFQIQTASSAATILKDGSDGTSSTLAVQALSTQAANIFTANDSTGTALAGIDLNGNFFSGANTGGVANCSGNRVLVNPKFTGGIFVGGSCSSPVGTLQNAYDNSSSGGTGVTYDTPTIANSGGLFGSVNFGCTSACNTTGAMTLPYSTATGTSRVYIMTTNQGSSSANWVTGVTDTAGDTWTNAQVIYGTSADNTHSELWYTITTNHITSATATLHGSTFLSATLTEIDNVASYDSSASAMNVAGTTASTPTLSSAGNNELIYASLGTWTSAPTLTGGGFTNAHTPNEDNNVAGNHQYLANAMQVASSSGSYAAPYSLGTSRTSTGITASFLPTTSGTPTTIANILMTTGKDFVISSSAGNAELTVKADGSGLVIGGPSSDPTLVAGGMYYNSATGVFRCSDGSFWRDCSLQYVSTTSDTALSTSATAISGISLQASKNYTIHAVIPFTSTVTNTNITLSLTTPTTPTLVSCVFNAGKTNATGGTVGTSINTAAGTGVFQDGTAATVYIMTADCTVDNSTNAGTFAIKMQVGSSTGAAKAGSSYSWYTQ